MTKILKILGNRGRITIPFEIRQRMGFAYNDVLSFTEADSRTVIVKRQTKKSWTKLRSLIFLTDYRSRNSVRLEFI